MKKRGFTLIELLVVISIIGVLAAIMFASFSGIQQKARDGQRKSDLKQIQAALEQYRADNGGYPESTTPENATTGLATPLSNGTPVYMTTIPSDPSGLCPYYYSSKNQVIVGPPALDINYTLFASIENPNDSSLGSLPAAVAPTPAPSPNCTYNYWVNNP